jgi:subtilisin family serine protease
MKAKAFVLIAALAGSLVAASAAPTLPARHELAKDASLKRPAHPHRLVVKFRDGLKVRARGAAPGSLNGSDLAEVRSLLGKHQARLRPLLNLPEATLSALEQRAERHSNVAQPDLASIMVAEAPDAELEALAKALNGLASTEFVYFEALSPPPPCTDLVPTTPSYVNLQGYRGPNPGINMLQARTLGNARGGGITITDCEYAFITNHEDLCNIILEAGQTPDPTGDTNHGTATIGEMVALDNAYGCEGLVPDATMRFYTEKSVESGSRRVAAITQAINDSQAGDIVVLEMQTYGPTNGLCPAEYEAAVWTVVKAGTDAGVIIVAAAGNGAQDLDWAMYQTYMNRGDSGAIIVGAGTADVNHNRIQTTWWGSTFGTRVNLQGWGENVMTLGYYNMVPGTTDFRQRYNSGFDGTSSATPMVASAAAAVQGLAVQRLGRRLGPAEMRWLLMSTGLAQGSGGHIGPLPDVFAAGQLVPDFDGPWVDFTYSGSPELGAFSSPFNTLAEGIAAVPSYGTVMFKPGSSTERMTISKPMTLKSPGGSATIGI